MQIVAPDWYRPNPEGHLSVVRDATHYRYTLDIFQECKSVLDVGCFDGWLDFLLIKNGFKVEGVEINPSLVDAARRYAKRYGIDYTIYEMPFEAFPKSKVYDAVLCYQVLEEVPQKQVETFIKKLETHASKRIAISLSQSSAGLSQNSWAANRDWIAYTFGHKPQVTIVEVDYDSDTPGNWFITYPTEQL